MVLFALTFGGWVEAEDKLQLGRDEETPEFIYWPGEGVGITINNNVSRPQPIFLEWFVDSCLLIFTYLRKQNFLVFNADISSDEGRFLDGRFCQVVLYQD